MQADTALSQRSAQAVKDYYEADREAESILAQLRKGQVPHNVEQYSNAYRLLRFLEYFDPIPSDQIPHTSLLREFLGGSSFHY